MKKILLICLLFCGLISVNFANASAIWSATLLEGTFNNTADTKLFYPNYAIPTATPFFVASSNDFRPVIKVFDAAGVQIPTRDFFDEPSGEATVALYGEGTPFNGISVPAGDYIVELSVFPILAAENMPFEVPASWKIVFYSDIADTDTSVSLIKPSTVPIPAAAWLFGTALLGFIGLRLEQI